MNITQYLAMEDKFKPTKMRLRMSGMDIPIKIYSKLRDIDTLYCNCCGAMPDKVYGTDNPNDPTECLKCFTNHHSADEFLT